MTAIKTQYVGRRVARVDALDKVTGRAVYGFDVELPGMLYGAVARSPFPHAKIVDIDLTDARKAPGVRVAVRGKDFPYTFGGSVRDQPFLAVDRVRYIGEPVAAVAAETEFEAQNAISLIDVKYDELPAVFDPHEAMAENAPLIHPDLATYPRGANEIVPGTNILVLSRYAAGDVTAGFTEADEIFEDEFSAQALSHAAMETHAAVARYDREMYTVWMSSDRPYMVLKELIDALGITTREARFIVSYVGGSFGAKNTLVAETIAIALARFARGRPVKVVYSREEDLTASETRVSAFLKLKTGVKKDGVLTARRAEILWDSGAYASNAVNVAIRGARTIFGPYRIPNIELVSRLVYTNKQISSSYRGYGTTQVSWACESQMDIIAERLGIDPLEIRLKNGYVEGDRYINGQVLHGVGLTETLKRACEEIGWKKGERPLAPNKARGKGLATMLKGTATPTASTCFIKVEHDAKVSVICTVPEIGGGQRTILSQIAAEVIGVPIKSISISNTDTRFTPYNASVGSSRTTYHMGNAVRIAGQKVRTRILEIASELMKTDPANFSMTEGKIVDRQTGETMTLQTLMAKKYGPAGGILEESYFTTASSPLLAASPGLQGMSSIFWMFASHAAEVEVDLQTGAVKVLKIAAAHDVGRAINPMGCEQQIEGAVTMGLSNTLFEEFKMENGRVFNDTLADYKLATFEDLPQIVPIIVESEHREAPFGAKGIGEPAAAATAPAIANAIYDAIGVRIKDLPITPDKILKALRQKRG